MSTVPPIQEDEHLTSIVREGLGRALRVKSQGKFATSNPARSSKFVFEVAKGLADEIKVPMERVDVQRVDDIGKKSSGEWLLDVCIHEKAPVRDRGAGKKKAIAMLRSKLLWAIESESHTGMKAFATDFAKLLHVRAENHLYLNGVAQVKPADIETYIRRRLETVVQDIIEAGISGIGGFFLGFWPSPKKLGNPRRSQWDTFRDEELLRRVRVYKIGVIPRPPGQ